MVRRMARRMTGRRKRRSKETMGVKPMINRHLTRTKIFINNRRAPKRSLEHHRRRLGRGSPRRELQASSKNLYIHPKLPMAPHRLRRKRGKATTTVRASLKTIANISSCPPGNQMNRRRNRRKRRKMQRRMTRLRHDPLTSAKPNGRK